MIALYKRDIQGYFSTFIGYIFIASVLLVGGIYCYIYNFNYGYARFSTSIAYLPFFFVFLIPIISSGIFTDEKRQKTEQLLYTLPISSRDIVLGKYLALLTVMIIPLIVLGLYPIAMSAYGTINYIEAYMSLIAVFLLAMTLCSICMFVSSLCENIVVSAVLCFATMFVLYQMDNFANTLTASARNSYIGIFIIVVAFGIFIWYLTKNIYVALIPTVVLLIVLNLLYRFSMMLVAGKINIVISNLALFSKIDNFMNGIFDVTSFIYYISITALFVIMTIFVFERKRWI